MNIGPFEMNAVLNAMKTAIQALRDWVTQERAQQAALKQQERDAVRAFQTAVISTSNYVERLDNGEPQDRVYEEKLANLWSDAAIAFYGINDQIPPLLHLKALSWSRPAQWIDEKVAEAGITLTEMNELLTQLLKKDDKEG